MTLDQQVAYALLLDAAEKTRAVVVDARSSSKPLTLTDSTLSHLRDAVNSLHAAQREMESIKE